MLATAPVFTGETLEGSDRGAPSRRLGRYPQAEPGLPYAAAVRCRRSRGRARREPHGSGPTAAAPRRARPLPAGSARPGPAAAAPQQRCPPRASFAWPRPRRGARRAQPAGMAAGEGGGAPPTPPVGAARPVPARNAACAASSCAHVLTGGGERRGREQPRARGAPARCRRAAAAV